MPCWRRKLQRNPQAVQHHANNLQSRDLLTRHKTGKRPQTPRNRPLQPLKRQQDKTFGHLRKLCLYGGVLPRPIEIPCLREDPSAYFEADFFRSRYFRGKPIFGVSGRFVGAFRATSASCSRLPFARNRGICRVSVIGLTLACLWCIVYHRLRRSFPCYGALNPRERTAVRCTGLPRFGSCGSIPAGSRADGSFEFHRFFYRSLSRLLCLFQCFCGNRSTCKETTVFLHFPYNCLTLSRIRAYAIPPSKPPFFPYTHSFCQTVKHVCVLF